MMVDHANQSKIAAGGDRPAAAARAVLAEVVHRARLRAPLLLAAGLVLTAALTLAAASGWIFVAALTSLAAAILSLPREPQATQEAATSAAPVEPVAVVRDPLPAVSWTDILDASPDPSVLLDAQGIVIYANPKVADVFPRARAGQPVSNLTRSPELLDAIDRVGAGQQHIVVQLEDRVPIQRRVSAIIKALAGRKREGSASAILIVFRDITDQEKLAQMRADFIAHASHELRTPLASLRGFVDTLQGPARDDPVARERFLGIMGAQATRMTRLIDDLLSLSRVEMNEHVPPQDVVDLEHLVGFVVQTLQPLADANETALRLHVPDQPCMAKGDWDDLVQVFQNLVQNAIKYGRRGGLVEVTVGHEPASGRPFVTVRDDGPGIPEQHLPRLTERFYRVNANASRDKGGTGLGLAIVKHIVTRHRGDLRIASVEGEGSTFTVVLQGAEPEQSPE